MLASPIDPFDPMDKAFKELGDTLPRRHRAPARATGNSSASTRCRRRCSRSRTCGARPTATDYVIAAKGAPEAIADLCHFDADRLAHADRAGRGGDGRRPARAGGGAAPASTQADGLPTEQHDFDFEYLGLAGLHDPVRPGVADAVAECRRAGVRTVMITGDYPGTALAIAREIGLDHDGGLHHRARARGDVRRRARRTHPRR